MRFRDDNVRAAHRSSLQSVNGFLESADSSDPLSAIGFFYDQFPLDEHYTRLMELVDWELFELADCHLLQYRGEHREKEEERWDQTVTNSPVVIRQRAQKSAACDTRFSPFSRTFKFLTGQKMKRKQRVNSIVVWNRSVKSC